MIREGTEGACAKKNVRCTSTRKETERKMERLVPKRYGRCGVKAKLYAIPSDTHQLHLIKLHHFKLEIFKSI